MDWGPLLDARHPSFPMVREIVADLRRDLSIWRDKVREFELASVNSTAAEPGEAAAELEAEVRALAVDIESYVAEINYLGVELDVQQLFEEGP
ncbi:MAG TPA: hypothetical protein VN602_00335 [Gemmatimonadaceae bacterium]|jgi:hypothetical protein|nr:hypothetical protein [Gemmatimonadaceae bacterium]